MSDLWLRRYEILLNNEELNTNQMKLFVGRRHEIVKQFRINLIAKLELEGINLYDNRKIPTELFLEEIGKDMNYFEEMMKKETILNEEKRKRGI